MSEQRASEILVTLVVVGILFLIGQVLLVLQFYVVRAKHLELIERYGDRYLNFLKRRLTRKTARIYLRHDWQRVEEELEKVDTAKEII